MLPPVRSMSHQPNRVILYTVRTHLSTIHGVMRKIDVSGQRFGRLQVVERHPGKTRHGVPWLCACDCGETVVVLTSNLISGNTSSCGCLHREQLIARNHLLAKEPWLVDMQVYQRRLGYRKVKLAAGSNQYKTRGLGKVHPTICLDWELTLEQYTTLVTSPCYYCGAPPYQKPFGAYLKKRGFLRNGIDRIDNALGYTQDNSISCCRTCNWDKRAQTKEQFLENTIRRVEHLSQTGQLPRKVSLSLSHAELV